MYYLIDLFDKYFTQLTGKKNVPALLEKGRSWTNELAAAAEETSMKAKDVDTEITVLEVKRDNLQSEADEGAAVAKNFNEILYPRK